MAHGRWPEHDIDHRNGVRDDNRLENLREATNAQNTQNHGRPRTNPTDYHGVSFDKAVGMYA
jgi:hypothetical protein